MKNYIYCHEPLWNKKGGVVGYLSHLYNGMSSLSQFHGISEIRHAFLFPKTTLPNQHYSHFDNSEIHKELYNYKDGKETPFISRKRKIFAEIPPNETMLKMDLNSITSIHIHGAYNFLPVYNFLKLCGLEEKVVKILTTHNPIKPELEDIVYDRGRTKAENMDDFHFIHNYRDEFAFSKADALFFPCREAMEPYYETWPKFADIIKDKPVYFSATGAGKSDVVTPRDVLRRELNIPFDATVFLYIGRFMQVRGIDTYVAGVRSMLENNPGCYFVAVGEEIPAPLVESPYWIQRGFTQYPADYMAMADCCVIASNHNYFDLGMIEILSQGKPLIASETGGCRYLKDRTRGVLYFERGSAEDLANAMRQFSDLPAETVEEMGNDNYQLYMREFTSEHFADGYLKVIDQVYEDFQIKEPQRQIVRLPFVNVSASDLPFPQVKEKAAVPAKPVVTTPAAKNLTACEVAARKKLPLYNKLLKPIVRPFVKLLGNDKDIKKFDADPANFFSQLKSPRYRAVGGILFPR